MDVKFQDTFHRNARNELVANFKLSAFVLSVGNYARWLCWWALA